MISQGDKVALKMHFGEPGNSRYIRPVYVGMIADFISECGGLPFAVDAVVMYKSERNNYFGYLNVARKNGFTPETIGCPVVISGGIDDVGVTVKVPDPLILDEVTFSKDIWEADFLFSMAHFTMHLEFPYAGCLKNVGMGCVDRATKMKMHSTKKYSPPHLNSQAANTDGAKVILNRFQGKVFGCNLAIDVTPECDCFDKTDLPIVPDIGIFLSDDLTACDQAAFDKVIAAPGYPGCLMEGHEGMEPGGNKVGACHEKMTDYSKYNEFLRLAAIGNLEYELIEI